MASKPDRHSPKSPPELKTGRYYFPYNPDSVSKARALRKNMTPPERQLWGYLRTLVPRVLRQRPIDYFIVDFYCAKLKLVIEVDFYCAKLKLVIEVDGGYHFTPEAQEYDQRRTARLEAYGITVIRFTNDRVLHDFEGVCSEINEYIVQHLPPEPSEEQ
jgi:very-short-patch-repair endonuclease